MDCQGQAAVPLRGFFIQALLLQSPGRAPEPRGHRQMFIPVTELPQQAEHLIGPPASGRNDSQGGVPPGMSRAHAFQQHAFEFAAVAGAVRVNAASAAIESGTRLAEPDWAG